MLHIKPQDRPFVGTILLAPPKVRARTLALFNSSVTENRIAGLKGYVGAVLFVAEADNKAFELVFWDSPESIGAAQGNYRFSDHLAVVAAHAPHTHLLFSPEMITEGEPVFRRNDLVQISGTLVEGYTPSEVAAAVRIEAKANPDTIYHIGPAATGGFSVVTISRTPHAVVETFLSGARERFRYDFEVLEAFAADPDALNRDVPFRLFVAENTQEKAHA